jgi:Neuraminidase (sialidase)
MSPLPTLCALLPIPRPALALLLAATPLSAQQDDAWNWSNDTFKPVAAHEKDISAFLKPSAFEMKQVFPGERLPNIVVTTKGTVIAATGWKKVLVRRSEDAGATWGEVMEIREGIFAGGLTVDEISGDILLFLEEKHPPAPLHVYRSKDDGRTWTEQPVTIHPNSLGHVAAMSMNEHGITLRRGQFKGRLIRPSRWYGRMIYQKDFPTHYTNAIFSDDGGNSWKSSEPFPEWGTGEACIAELSDGTLYYNSRRHWAPDKEDSLWRWSAISKDGGANWQEATRSKVLPDGNQNSTYGLMGGLVRLPVLDRDILVFSNIVHPAGRKNGHVWASFDGGKTWPVRRQVFEGNFAYSALNAGRPGTPTEGWIFLHFEGGPQGGSSFARFNLTWILEGEKTGDGDLPTWLVHR